MPVPPEPCDVLVLGGGPAGATAARLLSQWGLRVVVVTRPPAGETSLAESLTPSCQKFFDLLGISSAIDAAGFVRSAGHTVWWGSPEARVEPFAGGALGWQATTTALNAVMLREAGLAGADIRYGTLTAQEALAWPAAFVVDASGRTGVLARGLGGRRLEPGHRTVALAGTWHRSGPWPLGDWTHTLLESYEDGWAWSVPVSTSERSVAVMVDPRTTSLSGDGATAVYTAELAKTRRLAALLAGAELVGRPSGWDASMYSASRTTGDRWLLAGDAASFVDPLSSAGVRKAMASGWLAAIAVNTALRTPGLTDEAFALFSKRERLTYQQFLDLTRQYLGAGKPGDHPFWSDRTSVPTRSDDLEHAAIERAFDRIKAAPELTLYLGPEVRFEDRAAIGERQVVLERRLVTGPDDDGVRYVHGVDVVAMLQVAEGCRQVPEMYQRMVAESGAAAWPEFLTALATAVARRWLVGI